MTATTTAAPVATRSHVGWGDLLWLTWRQHRWTILGTGALVVAVVGLALGMAWHTDATGDTHELLGEWGYIGTAQMLTFAPTVFGAVIAVFWAAPLLSREYEQRTHLVVWSQDITPLRWLTGKVVLLGVTAVAFAAGLGLALVKLLNSINEVNVQPPFPPFSASSFEAAPQVQAGYAAFGLALGLAFSAVTRRTVPAMGLTLGVFFVTRSFVAGGWRPYFLEPLRKVEPYGVFSMSVGTGDDQSWRVKGYLADAAGNQIRNFDVCTDVNSHVEYTKCMNDSGIHYVSYHHPIERLVPFQWFETGVFAVLAAGLFALAFVWVRRARRV